MDEMCSGILCDIFCRFINTILDINFTYNSVLPRVHNDLLLLSTLGITSSILIIAIQHISVFKSLIYNTEPICNN